jgi:hypothetical protein
MSASVCPSQGIDTLSGLHLVYDAGFGVLPTWKIRSEGLHLLIALSWVNNQGEIAKRVFRISSLGTVLGWIMANAVEILVMYYLECGTSICTATTPNALRPLAMQSCPTSLFLNLGTGGLAIDIARLILRVV